MTIEVSSEPYNILMFIIFRFRECIKISNAKNTGKIIFPIAKETVTEIESFIKSLT